MEISQEVKIWNVLAMSQNQTFLSEYDLILISVQTAAPKTLYQYLEGNDAKLNAISLKSDSFLVT